MPLASLPLSDAERGRVRARLAGRMTGDDEIRVAIATERSQLMNRRRAEEVLAELVDDARRADRPRRPTRPTRASKRRRRAAKERRSGIKADRARRPETD
jgi:ribosome-associated protein